jgi:predicted 2-oxoglutarate/Fe(II)-dependent dioxygenase YbiX
LFVCRDSDGRSFEFYSAVTGKPVVMLFTGTQDLATLKAGGVEPALLAQGGAQALAMVPGDPAQAAAQKEQSGWPHRVLADPGAEISNGFAGLSSVKAPAVYVLDPNQRLVGAKELGGGAADLEAWIADMLALADHGRAEAVVQRAAPALMIPRALDPEDCDWLIGLWHNGERDEGTVAVGSSAGGGVQVVPTTKRREDYYLRDKALEERLLNRLMPRLVPEISKAFHFDGYAVETFKVGCYKAEKAGFFTVHRDDTSPATKNRKFAVTLNLNTGEYEGGDLRFPEYGPELFRPEKGAAVVFSCSLLHEVMPVTKGHRFVLLTFLTAPPQG